MPVDPGKSYNMNNPFKPVPQRPARTDPTWDQYRDPVFHQAFNDEAARDGR